MREYGSVHTCFWTHVAIHLLSDEAKLLALYLLSGPHTNMLGCFRLPVGYLCEDLNWRTEQVSKRLTELADIDFAYYDRQYHWIWLPKFLTWNPIENPNQGKSIRRLFEQVPKRAHFFIDLSSALLRHDHYLEISFKEQLRCLMQQIKTDMPLAEMKKANTDNAVIEAKMNGNATVIPEIALATDEAKQPVIYITLNNQDEFPILQEQVDEWRSLYPAIDVLQTLRHIRAWNQANPTRRKTKNGILRHIVAWLAKEQDQANGSHEKNIVRSFDPIQTRNLATAHDWLQKSAQPISDIDITLNEKVTP